MRPLPVVTLASLCVLGALCGESRAWPRPNTPTGRLIRPLLDDWSALDRDGQARAAHVFGSTGFRTALPVLRKCSERDDDSGAACLAARAALGDVEAASAMRRHLRESSNPLVLAVSAMTLATWKDEHSHPLVMRTLLSGRGGLGAASGLAGAVQAFGRPWTQVYLRLAWAASRADDTKLTLAARLVDHAPWEVRPVYAEPLARELLGAAGFIDSIPIDRHRLALATWGLSRGIPQECEAVLRTLGAGPNVGPEPWKSVGLRCARIGRTRYGINARPPKIPRFPVAPQARLRRATPEWLQAVDERYGMWTDDGRERLARLIESSARRRFRGETRWDALALARIAAGPTAPRLSRASRKESGAGFVPPEGFDTFEPRLRQPAWWPAQGLQLTIDDGPKPEALEAILDTLAIHEARATFFFVGRILGRTWVDDPQRARHLLFRVRDEGHAIGFHGMDHLTEPDEHMSAWRPAQIADAVALYGEVLALAAGRPIPIRYGRLPGGTNSFTAPMRRAFHEAGLGAPVHWTVKPARWIRGTGPEALSALAGDLVEATTPQIVLLHEYPELAFELDVFLSALRDAADRRSAHK